MKLEGNHIIIVSNEPWGDIWYSKHNWANELSKNNNVHFINPPKKWRIKNFFKFKKIEEVSINSNLKLLQYNNLFPLTGRIFFLFFLNECYISLLLKRFFKKNKKSSSLIFWTFDPYRLVYPRKIDVTLAIFHCVDDFRNNALNILCKNVDLFLSVATEFVTKLKKYGKPIVVIPHGISSEEFVVDINELLKINNVPKDYVLYIGNIDHRLDYNIIEQLLINFKDETFLFIGPLNYINYNTATKLFEQKFYSNLFHLGPIHFKKLKNYIAKAKICIAPMNQHIHGNMINHHKLLQYFSQGKAVFSPEFSEYLNSTKGFIYMYSDISEVIDTFAIVLKEYNNPLYQKQRIEYAEQHQYTKLIQKVEQFIS